MSGDRNAMSVDDDDEKYDDNIDVDESEGSSDDDSDSNDSDVTTAAHTTPKSSSRAQKIIRVDPDDLEDVPPLPGARSLCLHVC